MSKDLYRVSFRMKSGAEISFPCRMNDEDWKRFNDHHWDVISNSKKGRYRWDNDKQSHYIVTHEIDYYEYVLIDDNKDTNIDQPDLLTPKAI